MRSPPSLNIGKGVRRSLVETDEYSLEVDPPSSTKEMPSPQKRYEPKIQVSPGKSKSRPRAKFSWLNFRKLLKYAKQEWLLISLSLLFTVISTTLLTIIPLRIGDVLDHVTTVQTQDNSVTAESLRQTLTRLFYMIMGFGVTTYFRFCFINLAAENICMNMRVEIFTKFISNDMHFFEMFKSADIVSRLGSDVSKAKAAVSQNLNLLVRDVFTVVGNMIALLVLNWRLAMLVLLFVPFYSMLTFRFVRRNRQFVARMQDSEAEMAVHVNQKFSGILVVKAYSTEEREIERYRQINMNVVKVQRSRTLVQGLYQSITAFLPYISTLLVLWFGGNLLINGDETISAGILTSFILYCNLLTRNTSGLSSNFIAITNGTQSIQKVFEMMQYESSVDEYNGPTVQISGKITFDSVNFFYPDSDVHILKDLSLEIKDGQYVAFVGPSGSGKSTLVKLIQSFYKVTSGNIYFDHNRLSDINVQSVRKSIGFVNQDATLFFGTVKENIVYGCDEYSEQDIIDAATRAGCINFLTDAQQFPNGLQTVLCQRAANLSGGQRQRIAIARALLRRPKIIIFDQATSALDANSEQMVQESIEKLASEKENKVTIIVIAHRLSTILSADRIFVLNKGQLCEQGTHQQLRTLNGIYYQLIHKQEQGFGAGRHSV